MAAVIDKYAFSLFLNPKNFVGGANLAISSLAGLTKSFTAAALTIAGTDIFAGMLKNYNATATSLGRLSETTGEDLKTLEAWQITVRDSGGDVNALAGTIKGLNADMANFDKFGESKTLETFARLGISIKKANGETKQATELLSDFAKVQTRFNDRDAANFAAQLGIDEGTFIALRRAGNNIDSLLGRNKRLAVINQADVDMMKEFNALSSQFKQTWTAISAVLMREALPIVRDYLKPAFEAFVTYLIDNKENIKDFFKGAGEVAKQLYAVIKPVFDYIVESVKGLKEELAGVETDWTGSFKILLTVLKAVAAVLKFIWEMLMSAVKLVVWLSQKGGGLIGKVAGWFTKDQAAADLQAQNAAAQARFIQEHPELATKQAALQAGSSVNTGDIIIQTAATSPDGIGEAVATAIQDLDLQYNVGAA
ncbi:MAG: hypothetical protein ACI37O_01590 [Candidatus Avelusimicrobium sp.]|uniref:hypothetical protein n=1 Tax=Candidatus Avelusimicrobium sp. TaxID=3048833 RepID=UPI003F08B2A0